MLTTNVGIAFATHYCGGKAVKSSLSFINHDLSCGMTSQQEDQPCETPSDSESIHKQKCCDNTVTAFSVDNDYSQAESISIPAIDFTFVTAFVISFTNHYFFLQEKKQSYAYYFPPSIEQDKSILFQVFLI